METLRERTIASTNSAHVMQEASAKTATSTSTTSKSVSLVWHQKTENQTTLRSHKASKSLKSSKEKSLKLERENEAS